MAVTNVTFEVVPTVIDDRSRRPLASEWMGSRTYRAEAIVLKTLDLGEADRILTLLTRHFGKVKVIRDEDLFGADEAFLTSTTREAVPIVRVDNRKIGAGVPGPVTRALLEGFRKVALAPRCGAKPSQL